MAGFTALASDTTPDELVAFLNSFYTRLDGLVERHGLEKVKTTGDAYMVVSGVPEPVSDHAAPLAALALDIRDALYERTSVIITTNQGAGRSERTSVRMPSRRRNERLPLQTSSQLRIRFPMSAK